MNIYPYILFSNLTWDQYSNPVLAFMLLFCKTHFKESEMNNSGSKTLYSAKKDAEKNKDLAAGD